MPSDDIYLPVHVGKKGKTDLGYQGDDTGDNISDKNTNYCELTGLYWAWKLKSGTGWQKKKEMDMQLISLES